MNSLRAAGRAGKQRRMPAPAALLRFRSLAWRERLLLGEALAALALASLAIALLPFRAVAAAASRGRARGEADAETVDAVRRAVEAWARRVPWRAVCFQRGLAVHWMLRRRGIGSLLHYGVRQGEDRKLAAHVWVSAGGRDAIGGKEAAGYACLATFPANGLKD